ITGLWEGVINMKDTAVRKVKEVGTGMINGIKGIFKSSSPSKVFHEIGEGLMEGLDNGIELAKKLPEGTLSELAKKLLGDIKDLSKKLNTELERMAEDTGKFGGIFGSGMSNTSKKDEGGFDIFGSGMSNSGSSNSSSSKDDGKFGGIFGSGMSNTDDPGKPSSSWKVNPNTGKYEKTRNLSSGMSYVPYDNFSANLHKGEAVLTASENKEYNKGKAGVNINNLNITIPAKDVLEFKNVTDFFNKIGQVAKAGVVNG
ncbi:MAG TPA: hypothetical protein VFC79_02160, partial [Tissierellaceae bacterium]|nr:hypothetical protein [Tissierellaceae bacterium]